MSQKIPVTRDNKRGSDILLVDSSHIVKIDKIHDREFMIHTKEQAYFLNFSLSSMEEWLYEDGFRLLDSGNIVNMNLIQEYDPRKGVVYFGDPADGTTKTASAARIQKEHIETVMSFLQTSSELRPLPDSAAAEEPLSVPVDEHGLFSRSYATLRAVHAKRQAEEQLVHMAYHDPVTRLPNRLMFQQRLQQSFVAAEQTATLLAVIFFDLDRFKIINDTLGHPAGDRLLQNVTHRLTGCIQEPSMVARFGGDEFMILLPGASSLDEVIAFARGITDCLSEPFFLEKQELYVSASIGISLFPNHGQDADTLIKNADVAMYKAKEKGGSTFEIYHPDMDQRSLHRLHLEIDLRKALERREFVVYYQPLVDLTNGQVFGMESLVRWKHPQWGMVSPGEFIPLAEETGLIVPIGNWVLREACLQNKKWNALGLRSLCVSVNISVNQFMQQGFVQLIEQTLQATGLAPHLLCLEITESVAMKNVLFIMETLEKLRKIGVQISIDDFGTGYSSLSYLKRFRVHTLKIDQSFIRDVTTDEDNAAIVTALIGMSQQLKIKSLAEGVETVEQLQFLKELGCNEIQGYIFSTPLPPDQFELLVKENRTLVAH